MFYLLKTEPSEYSFADLERDGSTVWDGVTNPQALKYLRTMNKGDQVVIYHTGDEKRAVGIANVVSVDATDPKTPRVVIAFREHLSHPHTLAELKNSETFAESPLVRQGRLSVVPLTTQQYRFILGE